MKTIFMAHTMIGFAAGTVAAFVAIQPCPPSWWATPVAALAALMAGAMMGGLCHFANTCVVVLRQR